MSNCTLSAISDNELLARLQILRRRERETTLEILFHLNEVERRKLHLKLGYSSMFVYCTEHLRYSESAAGRRVQAARCVARFPQVAALLHGGDVNLSTLGLVAGLLTEENADEFLARICGKNQREVEAIACAFRPPVRLRDRAQRVTVAAPVSPSPRPRLEPVAAPQEVASNPTLVNQVANSRCGSDKSPSIDKTEPSAARTVSRLYIQFLADEEFMRKYDEVSALLSNRIPKPSFAAVFGALLEEFLARHSPKKRQQRREAGNERAKRTAVRAGGSSSNRAPIPTETRDAVYVRDRGRCTFVGDNGRRCGETRSLHIDHIVPKARNGSNDVNNLRLLCARHNQLEAERILGAGLMAQYQRPREGG